MIRKILGKLDARDYHAYTGIILLSVGGFMIYRPAAFVVAGALLLWLAVRR